MLLLTNFFTLSFSIAIISYIQNKINLYSKRKHTHSSVFSFGNRHLHILPGRVQPSTFCTTELNFCVRYENRWDLSVIDTGNGLKVVALSRFVHSQLHNNESIC